MKTLKKFAFVAVMTITLAFSLTACSSEQKTSEQQTTTVDAKAEQDSKRAAYREEQSRIAESKAAATEAETTK